MLSCSVRSSPGDAGTAPHLIHLDGVRTQCVADLAGLAARDMRKSAAVACTNIMTEMLDHCLEISPGRRTMDMCHDMSKVVRQSDRLIVT